MLEGRCDLGLPEVEVTNWGDGVHMDILTGIPISFGMESPLTEIGRAHV